MSITVMGKHFEDRMDLPAPWYQPFQQLFTLAIHKEDWMYTFSKKDLKRTVSFFISIFVFKYSSLFNWELITNCKHPNEPT